MFTIHDKPVRNEDPDPDWQPLVRKVGRPRLLGLAPVLLALLGVAQAGEPGSGMLQLADAGGRVVQLASLDTRVDCKVSGLVADVSVTQTFRNRGDSWMEGSYLLPLPPGAAVYALRMQVGDRVIVGEVREKQAARRIYRQARDSGRHGALVEADGNNLFRTQVSNVAPHQKITVSLHYWQRIDYREGRFSLRFPLTYTPRYRQHDAATVAPDASTQGSELFADSHDEPGLATRIRVHLDAGVPLAAIRSDSHAIVSTRQAHGWEVQLRDEQVVPDRDFTLTWTPQPSTQPNIASFRQRVGNQDYAMLMLMPPQQQARSQPRELILVIDTSGSMGGSSIRQARAALDYALAHLDRGDRFNIIEFNSVTRAWRPHAVAASAEAVAAARTWVAQLEASGGTEMAPALRQALACSAPDGYVRQVVFVTDGAVGDPSGLMQIVDADLGASRLFPVGIGSAPNAGFLKTAARHGRGSETVIADLHHVGEAMQRLLAILNHPALTDLKVDWPAGSEAYPRPLPDLYLGEPLLVTARLGGDTERVQVHGRMADRDWSDPVRLDNAAPGQGLDRLWATSRIADLEEQLDRGGDRAELRQAIVDTALPAHLVSRFTSLVAVDQTPARPQAAPQRAVQIPNVLPAGSAFAQTATPARLLMLLSALVFLMTALLACVSVRTRPV